MKQAWRWYGPVDPVSLSDVAQAGATDIVSALHHVANGEVWSIEEIRKRQEEVKAGGLIWSVVESIPIHEDIKTHSGSYEQYINNYKQSIRNLATCGINIVCYNFMPVLDWTRTDLEYEVKDGSRALRFDQIEFAVFDIHLLQRQGAKDDYTSDEVKEANECFNNMTNEKKEQLIKNIIAGLPGAEEGYTLDQFRAHLKRYQDINKDRLRENFAHFLKEIIPVASEVGVRMAVHPDDPPRPILGLPRIVSNVEDMRWMKSVVDDDANGYTFCTGSFGVITSNDMPAMIEEFASRIHFIHLRATKRESNPNSFHEADHLYGDVDMYEVIKAIAKEEHRRKKSGDNEMIPMRPDHGHKMLDDLKKKTNPGYSAIGRLRGLAELRGLEMGINRAFYS